MRTPILTAFVLALLPAGPHLSVGPDSRFALVWGPPVAAAQVPATAFAPVRAGPTDAEIAQATAALSVERRDVFARLMGLPAEEALRFWPVYDRFETARRALHDDAARQLRAYAASFDVATGDQAWTVASRAIALEQEMIALRARAAEEVRREVSPAAAARFTMIDDYLTTAIRLKVLTNVPLAGGSPAP
ncbi:MAG TPA: hypothetical protein VG712_03345 [Gemmatimonadales bacterium]|nr:hypothetical protein [Gemmatimonadales bacterium]